MVGARTDRRVRRAAAALLAVAVALPAASCGNDDEPADEDPSPTTESSNTTAPSTTLSPEAEVEAAHRGLEAVLTELGPAPNPDDPRLPELVLEPELTHIRDSLRQRRNTNQVYEIGEETRQDILSTTLDSSDGTATLVVCAVGAHTLIDRDTGDVLTAGANTSKQEVIYQQSNGRWMLMDVRYIDGWEGVTACDG